MASPAFCSVLSVGHFSSAATNPDRYFVSTNHLGMKSHSHIVLTWLVEKQPWSGFRFAQNTIACNSGTPTISEQCVRIII